MRLIDADKAKAELLRMVGDIHGWGEFFDGIRSGYQSAADRLDTMPVAGLLWTVNPNEHTKVRKINSFIKTNHLENAYE